MKFVTLSKNPELSSYELAFPEKYSFSSKTTGTRWGVSGKFVTLSINPEHYHLLKQNCATLSAFPGNYTHSEIIIRLK